MKTLIKALFAVALCLPLTLSAQWIDNGASTTTTDNVGIGTTAPSGKLHISAGNSQQGLVVGSPHGNVHLPYTNGWSYIGGKGVILRTNGNTERLRITQDGKVGIATSAPKYKLEVKGNLYANGGWVRVSGNNGIYFESRGGGFRMQDNTWIRTYGNKSFYHNTGIMRTDGTFQVGPQGSRFIVTGGNVGIGIKTPSNKLEVNGTIRAKEVKVELANWGDYVFYDDYQLPTLTEEAAHIEAKGHLLGFESAEDMADELKLGDVSKRQQVKIEEMMLHLIDMNKKIEKIEAENTELKAQLEAIKK